MVRFDILALCALHVQSAIAAAITAKSTFVRCGTENPSAELLAEAAAMAKGPQPNVAAASINVKTYFHVVTTQAAKGSVTQTQLNNQV